MWRKVDNPSELYAFAAGFIVYVLLAKFGARPPVISSEAEVSGREYVASTK